MDEKHVKKLTLLLSVALAAGVMTAIQSCSKDEGPGGGGTPEQKFKMTMTCTQKDICDQYTRFNVLCTAEKSVYKLQKYFYVDTVPYSGAEDRRCEGVNKKNSIDRLVPKEHYTEGVKAEEGEMVVLHPFDTPKKLYIGAYVVSGADTVWSEPFVYDAPVNPTFYGIKEITEVTAHSITAKLTFSRPVGCDEFALEEYLEEKLLFRLRENQCRQPDIDIPLTPYEGVKQEFTATFTGLIPDADYILFAPWKSIYRTSDQVYLSIHTPAE